MKEFKIDKKTIIIILVVAVFAYLLWKKSKENATQNSSDVPTTAPSDPTSLNYILTHVNFTSRERQKIEALRNAVDASEMNYQSIMSKANNNKISFDQQLVLDAIWSLYTQDGHWIAGPDGSTSYGWNLQQKVLNLK